MASLYDTIGVDYADRRRPDPRIAAAIDAALGDAATVLSVGAGTGAYEPPGRTVTAVEPSIEMIRQRRRPAASVVQAAAEDLPFADDAFDAAMAVLTVHHWRDRAAGLREMRRVTRGPIVVVTFDPACRPWLTDYFPALATLDEAQMPGIADVARWLGAPASVAPQPVPHDCSDGFLHAFLRRPRAYLDPRIRSGMSSFWRLDDLDTGLRRLAGHRVGRVGASPRRPARPGGVRRRLSDARLSLSGTSHRRGGDCSARSAWRVSPQAGGPARHRNEPR